MSDQLLRRRIIQSVVTTDGMPLVYLKNPKVACTTIMAAMWEEADRQAGRETYPGNPHLQKDRPFLNPLAPECDLERLAQKPMFSMVRNPYTRTLSAYRNKIGHVPNGYNFVWEAFCTIHDVDKSLTKSDYTFKDFLRTLAGEVPHDAFEQHFRPQHLNIFYNWVPIDWVGHSESSKETFVYMESHGIPVTKPKAGKIQEPVGLDDFYDDEAIDIVRTVFAEDFRLFGYSTDPRETTVVGPLVPPSEPGRLVEEIRALRLRSRQAA